MFHCFGLCTPRLDTGGVAYEPCAASYVHSSGFLVGILLPYAIGTPLETDQTPVPPFPTCVAIPMLEKAEVGNVWVNSLLPNIIQI